MAQGRVALPRPQQGGTSVDTLHASCPLQTLQVSSALAKTDADSTGSSRPQDMGVPPAINILLVALEHLPSWFPQDRLVSNAASCQDRVNLSVSNWHMTIRHRDKMHRLYANAAVLHVYHTCT